MLSESKISRITEWWRPKAGVILSLLLFYFAMWDVPYQMGWKLLLYSSITLFGFGATGYFLNDLADLPHDRKVGKPNILEGVPVVFRLLLLLVLLAITLFPWVVFLQYDTFSLVLIGLQFLLMVVYPLPPARLKDRPMAGMVADALYAFVVPSVLAWHTMDLTAQLNGNTAQMAHFPVLALWMLCMGIRHIINHHVADRENDRITGTPNLALRIPPLKLRRFIQSVLFPSELLLAILFFLLIGQHAGFFPTLIALVLVVIGAGQIGEGRYWFSVPFGQTALDRFVSFYLGLISAAVLLFNDLRYVMVLIAFVALLSSILLHPGMRSLMQWAVGRLVYLVRFPFRLASLLFNWALYYFRKWILGWSEERNWGAHYPKRLSDLALRARKQKGTVAVFNQNRNKYTETFVNGHLDRLPFHVIPFYGWPHPVHVGNMENLIAHSEFLRQARSCLWKVLDKDERQQLDRLVAHRLIKEDVDLILAEFGTVGARVVGIAEQTGIPLVVIFYGYDAWKADTLEENRDAYQQLFKKAVAVIGVSRDICTQLQHLGCPAEKTVHLPCFVDLDLFSPTERNPARKVLLAVGRFCVTKAPHLTILAFNEVLKTHPEAELRMIGEDEGNGILEACKAQVNGLRIAHKVHFLGARTPEEVAHEMRNASVFVQHSVTAPDTGDKEGTPVAVMEAMASGLPVVSTRHAGIAEMIEDGRTGLLVDEFDYLRMAEKISKLLKDPEQMITLGNAAARSIRTDHLVKEHIQELTRIIDTYKVK